MAAHLRDRLTAACTDLNDQSNPNLGWVNASVRIGHLHRSRLPEYCCKYYSVHPQDREDQIPTLGFLLLDPHH
jgi:hypothetical protein